MFSSLVESFTKVLNNIKRKGSISANDLESALREIRISMLEADVALSVTKEFIQNVKEKALGEEVVNSITPGQLIVKIVHDELKNILGDNEQELNLNATPPIVIMLVGLQGVGKTTTAAKLAVFLRKKYKKKPLLASLDTYRPAAQEQLETLGKQVSIETLPIITGQMPIDIAKRSIEVGKSNLFEVIILDTAGRLHSDEKLIEEIKSIKKFIKPVEILLVADSMSGQDAVNSAKHFHDAINLSGVILTRIDGDSRGGAALSIKYITGCPIKFIGHGEKISDLERFYPDRIASRILDMGDVVTLVEKAIDTVSEEEAENLAKKMQKGNFDMEDLRKQLKNLKKMGGFSSVLGMLPGLKGIKQALNSEKFDKSAITKQEAIIDSMTKKEKSFPKIMNASRKNRVAKGAGVTVQDINKLLKQFLEMQKMMKKVGNFDEKNLRRFGNMLDNKYKNKFL
ncbi:signal recognition particle protein [Candidatus Aquarickettsia rohweri]|uniref:Signal recognition particle protein n=1 Tax=Candidatus Aquarickettsia rohweri TaxID=2602574 RepID=A0A3R9XZ98_9RICK|nr:signal recognition particle protein [Candidatus Aquarickettsia rohweri]RST71899.1 signal recognition particle protein [Candidatus Aquarickettsia rohweri]